MKYLPRIKILLFIAGLMLLIFMTLRIVHTIQQTQRDPEALNHLIPFDPIQFKLDRAPTFSFYPQPTLHFKSIKTSDFGLGALTIDELQAHWSILNLLLGQTYPSHLHLSGINIKTFNLKTLQALSLKPHLSAFPNTRITLDRIQCTDPTASFQFKDLELNIPVLNFNAPTTLQTRMNLIHPEIQPIHLSLSALINLTTHTVSFINTHLKLALKGWHKQPLPLNALFNLTLKPHTITLKDLAVDFAGIHLQGDLTQHHADLIGTVHIPDFNLHTTAEMLGYPLPFKDQAFERINAQWSKNSTGLTQLTAHLDDTPVAAVFYPDHTQWMIDHLSLKHYQPKATATTHTAARPDWINALLKHAFKHKHRLNYTIAQPILIDTHTQLLHAKGTLDVSEQSLHLDSSGTLIPQGQWAYAYDETHWLWGQAQCLSSLQLKHASLHHWLDTLLHLHIPIEADGALKLNRSGHCTLTDPHHPITSATLNADTGYWHIQHPIDHAQMQALPFTRLNATFKHLSSELLKTHYQLCTQHQIAHGNLTLNLINQSIQGVHRIQITPLSQTEYTLSGTLQKLKIDSNNPLDPLTHFSRTLLTLPYRTPIQTMWSSFLGR
ncbi:MAG: hypothetical protein CMF51_01515 [Legionellales bacterium]|nr:hypothetical protein [Legionellales bacterium]